jgi:tRNA nucleotidyltransferase/poly(A) polymerase
MLLARLAGIEAALGVAPDPVLRLAALAVEVPEDAERLRGRLRLSNEQATKLARAAPLREADIGPASPEATARAWLYRHGAAAYRERVLLAWARTGDPSDSCAWRHRLALPERWPPPRFPLKGADALALGVSPGPRVGEILRTVEDRWVAEDFAADESALRARLAELVRD